MKLKLSIILLLAFSAAYAQPQPLSVKEAVGYATKNAVAVKNALVDIETQKQVNREITAAALPQINGNAGMNYFPQVGVQSFPNFIAMGTYGVLAQEGVKDGNGNPINMPTDFGTIAAQFGTKYTANAGVQLTQLLFDGQVFIGLQARDASLRLVNAQKDVTASQIAYNVEKIYYQIVVGQRQITSIDANVGRFQKLLDDTKEIFKNGFAEKLDVDKVTVQLNNLKTERIKMENQLNMGVAGLKFLMNMPQQQEVVLTDTLSETQIMQDIADSAYSYNDRKEYKLLEVVKEMNNFNIRRYKLSAYPRVALVGNYSVNAQRNKFNFFNNEKWYPQSLIGLSVSVPIFDGNARRAKLEQAKLQMQKTNNNMEQLTASIDKDAKIARLNIQSAIQTLAAQKENMMLAEKVYNTTKLKYEQGLGSNQEIYNAQTELKVAQNNYYSALYDAINAKVDYQQATGKLTF